MDFCKNCGRPVAADEKFCAGCGAEVSIAPKSKYAITLVRTKKMLDPCRSMVVKIDGIEVCKLKSGETGTVYCQEGHHTLTVSCPIQFLKTDAQIYVAGNKAYQIDHNLSAGKSMALGVIGNATSRIRITEI